MGQRASDGVVDFFLHEQHVQERLNPRQAGVGGLSPACMTCCHCVSLLFLLLVQLERLLLDCCLVFLLLLKVLKGLLLLSDTIVYSQEGCSSCPFYIPTMNHV